MRKCTCGGGRRFDDDFRSSLWRRLQHEQSRFVAVMHIDVANDRDRRVLEAVCDCLAPTPPSRRRSLARAVRSMSGAHSGTQRRRTTRRSLPWNSIEQARGPTCVGPTHRCCSHRPQRSPWQAAVAVDTCTTDESFAKRHDGHTTRTESM